MGDGNPHVSCRWIQVSSDIQCGPAGCSVSYAQGRTLEWSVAGTAGGPFATLGFGVTQAYTTSNEYLCNGGPNQWTCITAIVEYIEYTAKEVEVNGNCYGLHSDPYIIRAPSLENRDRYLCHTGAHCHGIGWEKWEHNGQPCPHPGPHHLEASK